MTSDPYTPEGLRFSFPDGELDEWHALGDVTDRSVRVWGRQPEGRRAVSLSVAGERLAALELVPDPAHDHVGAAVLTVEPARPNAPFRVEVGDRVLSGRFAPAAGEPASFSFAFGSCHQPFRDPPLRERLERHPGAGIYSAAHDLVRREDVRFLMLVGDQVYTDAVSNLGVRARLGDDRRLSDEHLVETYRHFHRGYFNERGFRRLTETLPTYLTWDDHDIYDGAGSLLHPTDIDRRLRAAATVAYREYQHLRNPGASLADEAPFAYPFWFADVGFFVLDLRGCREFHEERILGDEQWRRLDAFLAEAAERDVRTIFLVSSVPLVHGSPLLMSALEGLLLDVGKDIRDRWNVPHFRHEREAMFDRLFGWQAGRIGRQVAVLSGDVHVGAAFSVRPRRGRGRFVQWTSSAISTPTGIKFVLANRLVTSMVRVGEDSVRVWRRGLVGGNNLGLVDVAPDGDGGHRLRFRCFAWDGRRRQLRTALVDESRAIDQFRRRRARGDAGPFAPTA